MEITQRKVGLDRAFPLSPVDEWAEGKTVLIPELWNLRGAILILLVPASHGRGIWREKFAKKTSQDHQSKNPARNHCGAVGLVACPNQLPLGSSEICLLLVLIRGRISLVWKKAHPLSHQSLTDPRIHQR